MMDKLLAKVASTAASLPPGSVNLLHQVIDALLSGKPDQIQKKLTRTAEAIGLHAAADLAMEQAANAAARLAKTTGKK